LKVFFTVLVHRTLALGAPDASAGFSDFLKVFFTVLVHRTLALGAPDAGSHSIGCWSRVQ
jgi:hypothetical protein